MKKLNVLLLALTVLFALSGCMEAKYPDRPDNAIAFDMGSFTDKNDDDAMYATIEFEGRVYMPYGTIRRSIRAKDIDKCIGYLVQDGEADTDMRIYTLAEDEEHNYLMEYYVAFTEMNQPIFWRAVDTRGKSIPTPDYIDSLRV